MAVVYEVTLECQPSSMWWWRSFGVTYKSRHNFLDFQAQNPILLPFILCYTAHFPFCFQRQASNQHLMRELSSPSFIVR